MPAHRFTPASLMSGLTCLGLWLSCAVVSAAEITSVAKIADSASLSAGESATLSAISAGEAGFHIASAREVLAGRWFHHDARQPRPPRHRSERASSFCAEHDLAAAVISLITHDDVHRRLCVECPSFNPLSGHPLELLRPPSVWL